MTNLSGKCAIVGMGETVVGKRPDATTNSLHLEAIKACLDDAGIKASQVDGLLTNQPLNDSHRSYAVQSSRIWRASIRCSPPTLRSAARRRSPWSNMP